MVTGSFRVKRAETGKEADYRLGLNDALCPLTPKALLYRML